MKASKTLWIKRLVIGAAVAALPQVLLARGPGMGDLPPPCPPDTPPPGAAIPAPPGAPGEGTPALLPGLPLLHGLALSEAQQDAVFDLMHTQIAADRPLERKAAKALDELRRQRTSDRFNARQARALAEDYAQAVAGLAFNRAELDAKVRALLTPEQRRQIDESRDTPPGKRQQAGEH